jgi:hypothetical protein
MFWVLDGYFLWQEALFRMLYDKVCGLAEDQIDFSIDTSQLGGLPHWLSRTFSRTVVRFHGTVIATIVVSFVLFKRGLGLAPPNGRALQVQIPFAAAVFYRLGLNLD